MFFDLHMILFVINVILIFTWIIIKICNIYKVKKLNYKEKYKELKSKIRQNNISKKLNLIVIIVAVIVCAYFVFMIPISFIYWLLFLISLGGIGFMEAGVDSTSYFSLQNFYFSYMSYLKYTPIIINIIIYAYATKAIYNNILINRELKAENIEK